MFIKKLVALFLLALLAGRIAIADEARYDFTHLRSGEVAPFQGYLLKAEALVKIYTEIDKKEKEEELKCKAKLDIDKLEADKKLKLKVTEIDSVKKRYEAMLTDRKRYLEDKDKEIEKLNRKIDGNTAWVALSFASGIIISTGLTLLIAQMVK